MLTCDIIKEIYSIPSSIFFTNSPSVLRKEIMLSRDALMVSFSQVMLEMIASHEVTYN